MSKFEVSVIYRGHNNYIVEAEDESKAINKALERYNNGENGEALGTEWECVDRVYAMPIVGNDNK